LDHNLATSRSTGNYTFRIQGSAYHLIGSALPDEEQGPKYSQIYIYDVANELNNRHSFSSYVSRETLGELQTLLHQVNPFVDHYKFMTQVAMEQQEQQPNEGVGIGSLAEIRMVFRAEGTPDKRRYNRPTTSNEVDIIMIGGSERDNVSFRDIVIHFQNNEMHRINEMNQYHDPLSYALMFPEGDTGWHCKLLKDEADAASGPNVPTNASGIILSAQLDSIEESSADVDEETVVTISAAGQRRKVKRITIMEYYSYRLMYRPNSGHLLHLYRNLFHQYILISYDKLEKNRLLYIKGHQAELRADMYKDLKDATSVDDFAGTAEEGGQTIARLGTKAILPSTFIGGPRHMTQLYQDALSIVRRFGKPDYFITFTCNPSWPEIQRELLHGQQASDRPDLCARVFNMKLNSLIVDITKNNILGKMMGFVYTIEFQKRGLPHAHILLIVDPEDKPNDTSQFDDIVSAELPNSETHPLAYETVSKNMLHGPCGLLIPNTACTENGKCTKRYPKEFTEETTVSASGGYPHYRRRNDGKSVQKRVYGATVGLSTVNIDNRWVVPHNLYLCSKYDAHINVEICSSINAIKYAYKYVYKGHDRVSVTLQQDDEVKAFVDARYVSAPEACWRTFSYHMHKEFPAHQRLAVHLEDEQNVYFRETEDVATILRRGEVLMTTLTAWFDMNRRNPDARGVLYPNFPEKFVWNPQKTPRQWTVRERRFGATIGRIYNISPRQVEKFYLRMLLYHIPGAKSFADMRTVGGVVYDTYKATAQALGLLESDDQWNVCLQEAATLRSAFSLRALFCIIIAFCEPASPYELWLKNWENISEDYIYRMTNDTTIDPDIDINDRAKEHCILDLNDTLQTEYGIDITTLGFQLPSQDTRYDNTDASSTTEHLIREHQRLIQIAQDKRS
jgi:hypothetical protein